MPIEPREPFWNIDPVWLFYTLSLVAALLFGAGALRAARHWASGWRVPPRTSRAAWAADVLAGAGIFRGDRPGGLAHLAVLWGFVVLFIGTVLLTVDHYVVTFLAGRVWLVYSLVLDLFGAAFVLGLLWLLVRRHLLRRRLMHAEEPEDSLLLVLLLFVAVTGFLVEALRIAETGPAAGDWSPVGALLARLFPPGKLEAHRVLWWLHAGASLLLVAWIPFGKLRHVFASALHRAAASRTPLPRTAQEREQAAAAFGAHELLALDACTRCNRCESACPSAGASERLSPRAVIAELGRAGRSGLEPARRTGASEPEVPWLCTSCGACRAACPVRIDAADLIRETRGYMVEAGSAVPERVAKALESTAKHGNPWEGKRSRRAAWAEDLGLSDFSRGGSAPLLWLPGCTLAYDTRCQLVARATARLLAAGGARFMIAGKREISSGELARRCGEDGLFEMMVEENATLLAETGASAVVVSSPHDWHALAFEHPRIRPWLPDVEESAPPVRHVTELLAEKVRAGALRFTPSPPRRIAFHDPCYLGRHHGLLEPPREILRALPGATLVELPEHGVDSRCCGGGGGRMWFEPAEPGAAKMSERRVRQAADVGADVLATACPWCLIQFEDAVKTAGLEQRVRVADLTELAAEGLQS